MDTTLTTLALNPLRTNCYILQKGEHCVLFDPSIDKPGEISKILSKIEDTWIVDAILLTHGHFDHISAVDLLVAKFDCPVYIHYDDLDFLGDPRLNASALANEHFIIESNVNPIQEGTLQVGDFIFDVVSTPGHTPGSVTYFYEKYAFCGDCIFAGSIGRTDLKGGSQRQMNASLEYFKNLQEDYILMPGHGPRTKLSKEKLINPYLNK